MRFFFASSGMDIAIARRGQMFGELGLLGLTETGRRMRTAVSISECQLLRMSKKNFQTLILGNNELRVSFRHLAQKFVNRLLEEMVNHKSPIYDIDKHVHIYASWQKDKIPDDLRIQGKMKPPEIDTSLYHEEKMLTTTISLQLLLLSGFPMLHMAKGGVSVRFIISFDVGGLGKPGDVHVVQHEATVTQGKPLELDFSTLLKYRHGSDKKQAIVYREDVTIKVVYMRWIAPPEAELAVSLGHEQSEQDGVQMPRSGSPTPTTPRGGARPAPHTQTTIGVFTMKLKDLVSKDEDQPIVRADDAPGLRGGGKGYRVTVLQGDWYTKTAWSKRELLNTEDPMELTIATKVSRELPTKSLIRSAFRRACQRLKYEGNPRRLESPKPKAKKEPPKPEENEEGEEKGGSGGDQTVRKFLQPLFEPNVVEDYMKKLQDIGCDHVRDMMSMTAFDLTNLGMKKVEDRKIVLSRLAAAAAKEAPKGVMEEKLKRTMQELKIGICNVLSKGEAGKTAKDAASFEVAMERSTDDLIKRLRELKDKINEVFIYNKNFELHMSAEMKHTLECLDRRIDSAVEMHVLALPVQESALKTWNHPMFVLNSNRVIQQNPKP